MRGTRLSFCSRDKTGRGWGTCNRENRIGRRRQRGKPSRRKGKGSKQQQKEDEKIDKATRCDSQ